MKNKLFANICVAIAMMVGTVSAQANDHYQLQWSGFFQPCECGDPSPVLSGLLNIVAPESPGTYHGFVASADTFDNTYNLDYTIVVTVGGKPEIWENFATISGSFQATIDGVVSDWTFTDINSTKLFYLDQPSGVSGLGSGFIALYYQYSDAHPSAVPEASSASMVLAGLGALVTCFRRKKAVLSRNRLTL